MLTTSVKYTFDVKKADCTSLSNHKFHVHPFTSSSGAVQYLFHVPAWERIMKSFCASVCYFLSVGFLKKIISLRKITLINRNPYSCLESFPHICLLWMLSSLSPCRCWQLWENWTNEAWRIRKDSWKIKEQSIHMWINRILWIFSVPKALKDDWNTC